MENSPVKRWTDSCLGCGTRLRPFREARKPCNQFNSVPKPLFNQSEHRLFTRGLEEHTKTPTQLARVRNELDINSTATPPVTSKPCLKLSQNTSKSPREHLHLYSFSMGSQVTQDSGGENGERFPAVLRLGLKAIPELLEFHRQVDCRYSENSPGPSRE